MNKKATSLLTSFAFWSLAALVLGLGLGTWGYLTESIAIHWLASFVQPLGSLWLRSLQLVVLPLVVFQLLTVLTGGGEDDGLGRKGARALVAVTLGSGAVMLVALVLAWPVVGLYEVSPDTVETIRSSVSLEQIAGETASGTTTVGEWISGLIPPNLVQAFAEGQIIQVLLVTLLFGLAVNRLEGNTRRVLATTFKSLNDAVLILVKWLLVATPLGVFSLMLGLALATGVEAAGVVVAFVLMSQGIQLVMVLALYPLAAFLGGTSLVAFARAVIPVQLVAVSTRSSLATMPVQVESGQEQLNFSQTTTGLLVPICVALFKITLLISNPVKYLFLAHVFGVPLSPGQTISFMVTVLLINFTELGLPRGGVPFRTIPAYVAAGIPVEGLVILQVANDLEDYPDTVANATGMFAAATVLSRSDRARA